MSFKVILYTGIVVALLSGAKAGAQWRSAYVHQDTAGQLVYKTDERGNIIPDFSRVGYYQGEKAIPQLVPVVSVISPGENDVVRIQAAIDKVSAMPLQANGYRGVLLLRKGDYRIAGTLFIRASGIVLRGEGEETKLIATGSGKRDLIRVAGHTEIKEVPATRKKVRDKFIPAGSLSLRLSDTKNLKPGDKVILFRPGTQAWIHDLRMDSIAANEQTKQWQPKEYNLSFERTIVSTEKDRITLDNPVMMEIDAKYGGAEIYKYTETGRLSHIGIENLQCISEFAGEEDEDHGWVAVSFNHIENSWVSYVTARHFGYACVHLGDQSKQVTVRHCRNIDPKSKITGSRRYSFNNDGQLNLFINCSSRGGRHDFITGAKTLGPNVFYKGKAEQTHSDIGPHHRWAVGTLYDNIITDGEINIQDRGNWGTGHGWSGVTQVLWNSAAKTTAVQSPWISGKNYAIGVLTEKVSGRLKGRPDGEWEGLNKNGLLPSSLFTAQLADAYNRRSAPDEKEVINTLRQQIISDAAWAMQQQPETVTAHQAIRSAGGRHDFYSEGDYWWPDPKHPDSPYIRKDGMTNPDNFTAHREALIKFSRIVGALASAYKITGDVRYAAQAMRHCRAWFADKETRMNPSLLYAQAIKGRVTGRGIGIIDTIHFIDVVMGLLTIQDSGACDTGTWEAIQSWFKEYLEWLTTHPYGLEEKAAKNNHGTCWVMQVSVFATFTGNTELLNECRERFKNILLPQQMAADGSFPLELERTKPYGYSIFNLDAMTVIAHVLSTEAENLWLFEQGGRSIKKAIKFLYPYLDDKQKWPFPKDVMYWEHWPVAPPSLLLGALQLKQKHWLQTWKKLDHAPQEAEVIRNLPLRYPLLWLKKMN